MLCNNETKNTNQINIIEAYEKYAAEYTKINSK
jgi:hypothetical protein